MTTICDLCESEILKYNLIKHKKSELCSKIHKLLLKKEEFYKSKLIENELTYDKRINEKNILVDELLNKINKLEQENNNYINKISLLEKSSEEYRKIVEKAATKTSIKNNYTNNYLNLISSEPIRFNELPRQLKQVVNCESLMYDDTEFHNHIVDNILKDENGKDKILCTDINRKNFSYKDESSGELVSDPELERLRDILKKGADIKSVKRELLDKLIEQYDNTDIDPYVKFCDILKKLDFGNPFVDHVAKKTYIKTKSVSNE
jgi:hypothetical protein